MHACPEPSSPDFHDQQGLLAPAALLPAIACLFVSLLLTLWVWNQAEEAEIRHARQLFELRAEDLRSDMAARLQSYHQVLRGGVGLFAASEGVTRVEWHDYVGQLNLEQNFRGIQALGFTQPVSHAEKDAFVQSVRSEGFHDFDIFPPGARDSYLPVTFIEPFSPQNRRDFGFDTNSEALRREAQARSGDSGETLVSGRLTLVPATGKQAQAGMLMVSPIYVRGLPVTTVQERRAALRGFVVGFFQIDDLMAGILGRNAQLFDLHIYDGNSAAPEALLYDSDASLGRDVNEATRQLQLDMFGRRWTILIAPTRSFRDGVDLSQPRLLLFSGMVLSVMLFVLVWALLTVRALAASRRRALDEGYQANLALKAGHAEMESTKALLQNIVDNLPLAVFLKDSCDGFRKILWNKGAEKIFGYPADKMLGTTAYDFCPREQADFYLSIDQQVMRERRFVDVPEEANDTPSRGRIYLHTRKLPLFDEHGEPRYLLAICEDITQRKRDQEQLQLAARVFANSSEGIVITDAANRIVSVNRAFTEISGYTQEEVLGRDPKILASHRQDKAFYEKMWASLLSVGHWQGEIWDRRKNGEVYPKWLTIDTVRNAAGEIVNFVAVSTDITERIMAEEKLRFTAEHDSLTGLPNRVLLADRFTQAVARIEREGGRIGLLFVDLDHFKRVNDSLGHAVGDRLLQQIATRLAAGVRATDTVTRIGGDEFIVMLTEVDSEDDVISIADHLLASACEPYDLDGRVMSMSFSVGISLYPEHGASMEVLLRCADVAMYAVKQNGRGCSRLYAPELEGR